MSMMSRVLAVLISLLALLDSAIVQAVYCGITFCTGDGAYCCASDSNTCCWRDTTYVYELWWFWFIWFVIFLFFATCLICIRRRRLANRQYIRVGQPVYGTTAVVTTGQQHYAPPTQYTPPTQYNPPSQYQKQPTAPQQQYAPSQQYAPPPTYDQVQKMAQPPYQ